LLYRKRRNKRARRARTGRITAAAISPGERLVVLFDADEEEGDPEPEPEPDPDPPSDEPPGFDPEPEFEPELELVPVLEAPPFPVVVGTTPPVPSLGPGEVVAELGEVVVAAPEEFGSSDALGETPPVDS
jgi:hypothetical protein